MSRLAACMMVLVALALSRAGAAASIEAQVRDAQGKPVADAAVYALSTTGTPDARGKTVAIAQVDREFVPYVTVLQAGTVASFPNRDPILHHVYSFSPAKRFEIKLYSGKSPSEVLFDKPGVVTLGCNIHDWMIGYVLVVSTPYFGRTDAAGIARLRDVPSGSYEIHAWHPQQRGAAAPLAYSLDPGAATAAAFTIDIVPRKAKYKPPLDRLKY
ncbi:MAG: methylamine utilization protein [Usitatibacter sp.]